MKRFYCICFFSLSLIVFGFAQDTTRVCNPDTAFVNSGAIVSPSPIQNDTLGDGLPDACLNTSYDLTIFVHPPSTFNLGTIQVPVSSFRIDSVINLPDGLNYDCSTEDCTFLADSINCIYLSGTPTPANTDSLYQLTIHLTVTAGGLGFAATFPDPALAPGSYHIVIRPEGDTTCQTTPTLDFNAVSESVKVYPNPAFDRLSLAFESKINTTGILRVWSHTGQLLKQTPISLAAGLQQFSIQVEDLSPGFYVVGLQTKAGAFHSKFLKS